MRLGTSWRLGHSIPSGVPQSLHSAILAFEAEVDGSTTVNTPAAPAYWKLTWLEGAAYLSCTLRQQEVLTLQNGAAVWRSFDAAAAEHPGSAVTTVTSGACDAATNGLPYAEDDDDWLL